jgi:protein tyrosine phosphatase (PTP) superfamily phosphohydrolase (DUF442 family)
MQPPDTAAHRRPPLATAGHCSSGTRCEAHLDLVAVPYIIHRDDLKKMTPLWKKYIIAIKARVDTEIPELEAAAKKFGARFAGVQLDWCAEMFGYVFAAAEANIVHDVGHKLQVRPFAMRAALFREAVRAPASSASCHPVASVVVAFTRAFTRATSLYCMRRCEMWKESRARSRWRRSR